MSKKTEAKTQTTTTKPETETQQALDWLQQSNANPTLAMLLEVAAAPGFLPKELRQTPLAVHQTLYAFTPIRFLPGGKALQQRHSELPVGLRLQGVSGV
jgi:hypothetical protein